MTIRSVLIALGALPALASAQKAEVESLLAADHAFPVAASATDVVSGLTPMFAKKVIMPVPGPAPKFAEGVDQVVDVLKANPANAGAKLQWTPIRGGVSADGQHAFTFGYMTIHRADGTDAPVKHLSYWIRSGSGRPSRNSGGRMP